MSWSVYIKVPAGLTGTEIRFLIGAASPIGNEDCISERDEQFAAAKEAAWSMIQAVVPSLTEFKIGTADARSPVGFSVSLGGHANPGHVEREGWARDTITVIVSQTAPVAKPEVAAAETLAEVGPVTAAEAPTTQPETLAEVPATNEPAHEPPAG